MTAPSDLMLRHASAVNGISEGIVDVISEYIVQLAGPDGQDQTFLALYIVSLVVARVAMCSSVSNDDMLAKVRVILDNVMAVPVGQRGDA